MAARGAGAAGGKDSRLGVLLLSTPQADPQMETAVAADRGVLSFGEEAQAAPTRIQNNSAAALPQAEAAVRPATAASRLGVIAMSEVKATQLKLSGL